MPGGEQRPINGVSLERRVAELEAALAAKDAALAALAAATGQDPGMPPQFATALGSAQPARHQAVLLGGGTVAVLGRGRDGDPARAWRMTAAELEGLQPRCAREIRRTGALPAAVEVVAVRRDAKIAVRVSRDARPGAVRCAMRALGVPARAAVLLPLGAGAAALGGLARAHALATSAAATAATAAASTAAAAFIVFSPPDSPPATAAARPPATPAASRLAAGPGGGTRGITPARRRSGTAAGTASPARPAAGRSGRDAPGTASPAPPLPSVLPSPRPSSPLPSVSVPLPAPSVSVTVPVPSRVPVPPVVRKVTHKLCHLNLLGIRVCVQA